MNARFFNLEEIKNELYLIIELIQNESFMIV